MKERLKEALAAFHRYNDVENAAAAEEFMAIFADIGAKRGLGSAAPEVQSEIKRLQDYITGHFYTCSDEILLGLGEMYAAGGEFTENIDVAGGTGTAAFTADAIRVYCKKQPCEKPLHNV